MEQLINDTEARVLGCLIEKELTTPEYYPLTTNSLLAACNQKSNRHPVMNLVEGDIVRALDRLMSRHLVWERHEANARVAKFEHNVGAALSVTPQEIAVLGVLMLRGAQTPGEIRGRSGRMFNFESVEQVEQTLTALSSRTDSALVLQLPRQAGSRENRWVHLLCGTPAVETQEDSFGTAQPQRAINTEGSSRTEQLEQQLAALTERMAVLEKRLDDVMLALG